MGRLLPILLALVVVSRVQGQHLTSKEREILTLQDRRSQGDGNLQTYLKSADDRLRFRACIAYANLQDSNSIAFVTPLLHDSVENVRAGAAFALGQIGLSKAQGSLIDAAKSERSDAVLKRIFEALGKCGDQQALDEFIVFASEHPALKAHEALSIARFGLRNIKSERSIWFCFDLLLDSDPEVQWRALYALWRSLPHGLVDIEMSKRKETLSRLASSSNPNVRMQLATLVGRSKSSDALDILEMIDVTEQQLQDWRVEVQILRGFGGFITKEPRLLDRLTEVLSSSNDHVKITALQVLSQMQNEVVQSQGRNGLRRQLLKIAKSGSKTAQLVQGEAFVALGKQFPNELFQFSPILSQREIPALLKAKYLEGLSFNPTPQSFENFLDRLTDESVRVSMAAWDFIKRFFASDARRMLREKYMKWSDIPSVMYKKLHVSLARKDMAVTTLVANAVADSSFFSIFNKTEFSDTILKELIDSYRDFSVDDGVEALQAILAALGGAKSKESIPLLESALVSGERTIAQEAVKALKRITGKDYSPRIPASSKPAHVDLDWQMLDSLSETAAVKVETEKGVIVMNLLKDQAPFTVLNFVRLTKKRFFDGLTWHRVVPNFVVQGGDPRGDGWGGPGYTIRSEFGLVNYESGTVGVASAGKDTEGCQFFITHSPQPHLDGRYTIFARVVSGMDVVDRLQVGDRILSMELVP